MRLFLELLIMLIAKPTGFMFSTAYFARFRRVKFKLHGLANAVVSPVLTSAVVHLAKPTTEVNPTASSDATRFSLPRWTLNHGFAMVLVIMLGAVTTAGVFGVTNRALFIQSVVRPVFCCGLANDKIVWPVVRPVSV